MLTISTADFKGVLLVTVEPKCNHKNTMRGCGEGGRERGQFQPPASASLLYFLDYTGIQKASNFLDGGAGKGHIGLNTSIQKDVFSKSLLHYIGKIQQNLSIIDSFLPT